MHGEKCAAIILKFKKKTKELFRTFGRKHREGTGLTRQTY